jgi:predicted  nucleic acid-binding Zn-ribbon protein
LVGENAKLNTKLLETSDFLQDVKTSKSMLEDDLSSVFQLYNMKSIEKPTSPSDVKKDLQEGISTLVEENAKLKVELKDSQEQKKELETQLNNTKVCYENFVLLSIQVL